MFVPKKKWVSIESILVKSLKSEPTFPYHKYTKHFHNSTIPWVSKHIRQWTSLFCENDWANKILHCVSATNINLWASSTRLISSILLFILDPIKNTKKDTMLCIQCSLVSIWLHWQCGRIFCSCCCSGGGGSGGLSSRFWCFCSCCWAGNF